MKERRHKKGSLQNGFIIMFYYPFQLFICGLLADYFSAQNPDIPVGEASPSAQSEQSCG